MQAAGITRLGLVFLILSLVVWMTAKVSAADISVDEDCPLSAAIIAANNDAVFDKCTAGDGVDTLTLTDDVTLSGRLPAIVSDMTIDGGGHTVSGNDSSRIFVIEGAAVTLEDMTVANGRTGARGGAIHVTLGDLTLNDAVVKDSWAGDAGGGIYASDSKVNISGSEVKDNTAVRSGGAGLYFTSSTNEHTLKIEEWSSFNGNAASQDGGAIRVAGGIVTIDKSGFSNNSADEGGVIEIWNGSLSVENTTMSSNHAREGGAINAGADLDSSTGVTLIHVTMANNTADERGAAIALTGGQATLSIGNTIISGDTDDGVTLCHPGVSEFSVISWVRNAISDGSCALPDPVEEEEEDDNSGDQPANQAVADDDVNTSLLAPAEAVGEERNTVEQEEDKKTAPIENVQLAAPRTYRGVVYYPLQDGSSAIDSANQEMCEALSDPDTDLVDTTRPQGDGCDIGAFELPWSEEEPTPEPTDEPPPAADTPTPPTTESPPPDPCLHIVASGDSLTTIALQYGTTIETLRTLNRMADDSLSVGQQLTLPGCEAPSPEAPFICEDVPFDIFITTDSTDIRCEMMEISDIDKHPSMNAGIDVAVEIWGSTDRGVEICLKGSGSLVFMDTEFTPPAVTRLPLYQDGDLLCARINKSGTIVQVAALTDETSIPLTNCLVTAENVLRLRDAAGGEVVQALVPFRVTMPARARTASWFFVEFMGMDGWLSADYVQTAGICE